MPRSLGRTGSIWRRVHAQVIAEEDTCCLCGRPVDKTLSGNHPWGPTVHHTPSLLIIEAQGLDPRDRSLLRLAHRTCNLKAGDGRTRQQLAPTRRQSRQW